MRISPWHYNPQLKFRRWPVCNLALEVVKNPLMCCVALLGDSKVGRGESHEIGIMYATCLGSVLYIERGFTVYSISHYCSSGCESFVGCLLSSLFFFFLLLSSLHFCFGNLFRGGETGYGTRVLFLFSLGNGRRGKTAPLQLWRQ